MSEIVNFVNHRKEKIDAYLIIISATANRNRWLSYSLDCQKVPCRRPLKSAVNDKYVHPIRRSLHNNDCTLKPD